MAKAGLLFVGTDDGLVLFSNPGAVGRWLRVGHELHGKPVAQVWAQPDNPQIVLAVAGDELWRSADGGQSWQQSNAAPLGSGTAFAMLAGNEPALLLGLPGGIVRSVDGGASWQDTSSDEAWQGGITVLVAASYHIDTACAGSGGGQVALSSDRGRSWHLIKNGLPPVRSLAIARLL